MLSRHSNSRFSSIMTNRVYLIFFAVAAGVAIGCLPFAGNVFALASKFTVSLKITVFCGCIFLLLFVSACGLSIIGIPCALAADVLFGFLISASDFDFSLADFASSPYCALILLTVYFLILACIFISDRACGFSKELYRHLCGSKTVTADLLKYAASVTAVLVFLVIMLLLQNL